MFQAIIAAASVTTGITKCTQLAVPEEDADGRPGRPLPAGFCARLARGGAHDL